VLLKSEETLITVIAS